MDLIARAKSRKAYCCNCGRALESVSIPLADVFVMDKEGNFYCMNCDSVFDDVDERIFDLDLEEEE